MCLERLGKLEIPNGIAGAAGPAGANGAGWASGLGPPSGPPTAEVLFYLNTASGELLKWNSSTLAWQTIVPSIFGTPGAQWLSGSGAPTNPSTNGYFYLDTSNGDIYQYSGGSWGVPLLNIEGTPGTNGVNGTGLLAATSVIAPQEISTPGPNNINFNCTLSFNAQQAFPTLNSVVKSTLFVKCNYSFNSTSSKAPSGGAVYMVPRIVNLVTAGFADLDVVTIDKDTNIDAKVLFPPSIINNNYTHGREAAGDYAVSNSGLPTSATSPGKSYPFAYTKIVSTFIRNSASTVLATVEYTTTTRYGTYTSVYSPIISTLSLGFGPSDGISIEQRATVEVPAGYPIAVFPIYHIVEKSIL